MIPVNFDLQKITVIQALRHVVPLVPGSIILAAVAVTSPEGFLQFMHIPELGYYAKLLLLLAAAYLVGFVLDEIVTVVVGSVFGLLTGWLLRTEHRRKIIDNALIAVAPWRDTTWQKLAASYLGPELTPTSTPESEPHWRYWYLITKAGFPELEEGFRRTSILMDAAQTSSWSLLIARIILPGHRYLIILILLTLICFLIAAMNKIILVLVSFGYFASDLTGAQLGAAMLQEVRKEKFPIKQEPPKS